MRPQQLVGDLLIMQLPLLQVDGARQILLLKQQEVGVHQNKLITKVVYGTHLTIREEIVQVEVEVIEEEEVEEEEAIIMIEVKDHPLRGINLIQSQ